MIRQHDSYMLTMPLTHPLDVLILKKKKRLERSIFKMEKPLHITLLNLSILLKHFDYYGEIDHFLVLC